MTKRLYSLPLFWYSCGALQREAPNVDQPSQEAAISKVITVVGAAIVHKGRILCAQRGPGRALEGKWEFPGGKIESGETGAEALVREIHEELRCSIHVGSRIETTTYEYDFGTIQLTTYYAVLTDGHPTLTEHSHLTWFGQDQLADLDWAPADIPAAEALQQADLHEIEARLQAGAAASADNDD